MYNVMQASSSWIGCRPLPLFCKSRTCAPADFCTNKSLLQIRKKIETEVDLRYTKCCFLCCIPGICSLHKDRVSQLMAMLLPSGPKEIAPRHPFHDCLKELLEEQQYNSDESKFWARRTFRQLVTSHEAFYFLNVQQNTPIRGVILGALIRLQTVGPPPLVIIYRLDMAIEAQGEVLHQHQASVCNNEQKPHQKYFLMLALRPIAVKSVPVNSVLSSPHLCSIVCCCI